MPLTARVSFTRTSSIDRLKAQLRAADSTVRDKAAGMIVAGAQARAPMRTGYLKSSIQQVPTPGDEAKIIVEAFYGIYVEFGTRNMHAQPYFIPAVEAVLHGFFAPAVANMLKAP